MAAIDPRAVAERLERVRDRITAAGGAGVGIVAVTKGFGADAIEAALLCGCRMIGENYAQELVSKRDAASRAEVHFIGQLQTNKVRQVAGLISVYETVDRRRLAEEIARRDPGAAVLVQVDTSGDPGKGGCPLAGVDELVEASREIGLDVRGMMTVGPTEGGPTAARAGFRAVRALVDRHDLTVCSMGMSDDVEVAVEEGSTQVRIGSALFGSRPAQR